MRQCNKARPAGKRRARSRLLPLSVAALHIGFMDTDLEAVKTNPAIIAVMALDGVEHGVVKVLTDEMTREARAALSRDRIAGAENTFEAWL